MQSTLLQQPQATIHKKKNIFDIAAAYNLGEVDANVGSEDFGEVEFSEGIGSQLNHARNDLDALISNFQFKGTYKKEALEISAGLKYQQEDIKDRIREWEIIDSLGFSVRPPLTAGNNQPYVSLKAPFFPIKI